MVTVSDLDAMLNSRRESLLSLISNASGNVQAQSIFLVIALLMAVVIFREFQKGTDERKGIWGPLAILALCLSIMFGIKIYLIGIIVFFFLVAVLLAKFKEGEWKGVIVILLVLYGLAFLVSINSYTLLGIIIVISIVGWVIKKANFSKIFGRSDAAKELQEAGVPVTKERRLMKFLGRIARKGFRWSKDKLVRTAGKIKQRFAERALENEAQQLREAEIVIAGENISKTLDEEEDSIAATEARDGKLIEDINAKCSHLEQYIQGIQTDKIETDAQQYIMKTAREILKMTHDLVQAKLSEENMIKKANKVFERSMSIIQHSANEATQLEEHKSQFKEMKKAAIQNIETMRKSIRKEESELKTAIDNEKRSKAEDNGKRISIMNERIAGLANITAKLSDVERFLIKIENALMRITTEENKSINDIRKISDKAKSHSEQLHRYTKDFDKEEKELQKRQHNFQKLFQKEEGTVALAELSTATKGTLEILQTLEAMASLIEDYHEKELVPLMQELAETAKSISGLSRVSEYLTKMYYQLSKANEALTKLAADVDKNPQSKQELEKIWQAEQFEENVILKEYRAGKGVVSHIGEGYKHLQRAYSLVSSNMQKLKNQENMIKTSHERIKNSLEKAFERLAKKEQAQQKEEQKDVDQAQQAEKRGMGAVRQAKAQ